MLCLVLVVRKFIVLHVYSQPQVPRKHYANFYTFIGPQYVGNGQKGLTLSMLMLLLPKAQ